MWIPARLTVPPGRTTSSATGTSSPAGANTTARSQSPGGSSSAAPTQSAPSERARSRCRSPRVSTTTSQLPVRAAPAARGAPTRRSRASATRSPGSHLGAAQRAVADHPRAQERRGFEVAERGGQLDREVLGHDERVGVAAVDGPPGEVGRLAEVLLTPAAVRADAARPVEPGDTDPVAELEARRRPRPRASTRPTTWWPGVTGRCVSSRSPSTTWRSVRQQPHAETATRISPGPGSGTGRSSSASGRRGGGRRRVQHLRPHRGRLLRDRERGPALDRRAAADPLHDRARASRSARRRSSRGSTCSTTVARELELGRPATPARGTARRTCARCPRRASRSRTWRGCRPAACRPRTRTGSPAACANSSSWWIGLKSPGRALVADEVGAGQRADGRRLAGRARPRGPPARRHHAPSFVVAGLPVSIAVERASATQRARSRRGTR